MALKFIFTHKNKPHRKEIMGCDVTKCVFTLVIFYTSIIKFGSENKTCSLL